MESSQNKKVTKIKTFPVPITIKENNKNIIINNNLSAQLSKEQIIYQACKFHSDGNIEEALKYYKYYVQKGCTDARIFGLYGDLLKDHGNPKEAFNCYVKVIELDPNYPNIYTFMTKFLSNLNPSLLSKSKLKNIFNILLEKTQIRHKNLFIIFQFLYGNELADSQEEIDLDQSKIELLTNEKIILNSLKKIMFMDIRLEKLLTRVRKEICFKLVTDKENFYNSKLRFIIALAEQCFLNEYIYPVTEEENIYIARLIKMCQNNKLNELKISILSCYFPLYKLLDQIPSLKSFNSSNQDLKELIKSQLLEPLEEIKLSKKIKKIGSINDNISQKVKSQYEENPYPRWKDHYTSKDSQITIKERINLAIKPNKIDQNITNRESKILIAGCGTGQHILNVQEYKNAKITGIDLSLSSLAYTQRKINEFEFSNVELIQMDILEVGLLKDQFDIIESSGVLHHMNDPEKGLSALLGILKNNGFLKLGLYSQLARQDVIQAKEHISRKKLKSSKYSIKNFREDVISGNFPDIKNIQLRSDFYSTSQCRDLCFHTQEHRFTIEQLDKILKSHELKFLGFSLPKNVKNMYEQYFPEDRTQTNLQNWAKFEDKHRNTFRAMYQFWVCKIKT